jgi:hypothetical protein
VECQPVGAQRVSDLTGAASSPALVWAGDSFGVAWIDDRDGNPEVYFVRLTTAGVKIGTDARVTNVDGDAVLPTLSWNGTEYAIAWRDDRTSPAPGLYFTRLDATGTEIGDDTLVLAGGAAPALAWNGTEYLVAGYGDPNGGSVFDIHAARVSAQGSKLGSDIQLTDSGAAFVPALTGSAEGYGLAWHDARSGAAEIYFALLDSGGQKQGLEVQVSTTGGSAPALVATPSGYAVAWRSNMMPNGNIWFTSLDPMGTPSAAAIPVWQGAATADRPSVSVGEDGFGVAWRAGDPNGAGDQSVALLDANGTKTSEAQLSSTASASFSGHSVARSNTAYGVVWIDSSEGTDAVYFATVCP